MIKYLLLFGVCLSLNTADPYLRREWHLANRNPYVFDDELASKVLEGILRHQKAKKTVNHVQEGHIPGRNDFRLAILTLKRMIDFLTLNKKGVIVDGMFGIRAVQGLLQQLIEQLPSASKFYKSLDSLYLHYCKAAEIIINEMESHENNYTKPFYPLIKAPIKFKRGWRHIRRNLIFRSIDNSKSEFTEDRSDNCILSLFGTATTHQKKCHITTKCIDMETQINTSGYILTHQLLYFLAGESHGCKSRIESVIGGEGDMQLMYDGLASNVANEMIKQRSSVKSMKQIPNLDLFFEQGYIAAAFGIVEAINFKNLRETLKLVSKNGCIKENEEDYEKRQDKLLSGCSQHLISVAMGYISQHIRFIVTPP